MQENKMEATMNFTMPRYADANDIVDRALRASAKNIPVSLANVMPALRWKLAGLEISEERLIERIKQRAAELGVTLIG
jgi:hypothetical protein